MASQRKSVLVTGCSEGGIGAGIAEAFQKKGYHVFVTLRNPSKTPPSLAEAPHTTILTLDVVSTESIAKAVDSVAKETGGRLDVLVNNSGQNMVFPALDVDLDEARKLFDLNFFAPLAMIQAFAPLLIKSRGLIVNNASAAGRVPMTFLSIYGASKAALIMATDIWRRELEPLGIRTMTLVTTSVKTPAFTKITPPQISEDSYYYVIRDYLGRLADGRLQDGGPTALECGLRIVREVEKGTTGEVWVGKDAGMNHWSWRLLPASIFEYILDGLLKASKELAKVSQVMGTQK